MRGVFVFFIVDNSFTSLKAAYALREEKGIDLFIPVRNMMVRSNWPENEGALTIPFLAAPIASAISNRRFSLREFVNGDPQGLAPDMVVLLQTFLYEVLNSLSGLEPMRAISGKGPPPAASETAPTIPNGAAQNSAAQTFTPSEAAPRRPGCTVAMRSRAN